MSIKSDTPEETSSLNFFPIDPTPQKSAIVNTIDMRKVSYVAYVPSNDVALLTVEMNPGNNWYNVYLNQATGLTGWVYNENADNFYTYRELFYKWGKAYGVKVFNDLTEAEKVLYSKEDKTCKYVHILQIKFVILRNKYQSKLCIQIFCVQAGARLAGWGVCVVVRGLRRSGGF